MTRIVWSITLALLCALPVGSAAQVTASLSGTVMDESKAVLPGVTVTATDVASGRQYVASTNERGDYRMPAVLPGTYRVQVELTGFATITLPSVELLVGQAATMPFSLKIAAQTEALTVTSTAPLINTQSAAISGNIDRRQMQELPVLGRNWLDMSLLVKGVTANTMVGQRAGQQRDDQFQLNLDGQQVTQNISVSDTFGQPGLSREAIQEYVLNTSGYDVSQGRSVGVTVQAISRSGTNALSGAFYGNFRDDRFIAKSPITNTTLPFENTQTGFSLGGPLVKNKLHFYANYEYEREPNTVVLNPQAYVNAAVTRLEIATLTRQHTSLARVDYQMSNKDRFNLRGTYYDQQARNANIGAASHPTAATDSPRSNFAIIGNWTRVISNTMVQELKAGYTEYKFANIPSSGVPLTPAYTFSGGATVPGVGASRSFPQAFYQKTPSVRYDLTWHKSAHDMKLGGEFLMREDGAWWPNQARGVITVNGMYNAAGAVIPLTAAEFARRFPLDAANDPSKWDLSGLAGNRLIQNFANDFNVQLPRKTWAIWAADTWAASDRLTLNYGIRWDVDWGALDPPGGIDYPVIMNNGFDGANFNAGYVTGIRDLGNIGPRGGVTFKVNDGLVLRGGAGLFYTFQESNMLTGPQQQISNVRHVVSIDIANPTGRQDFVANPLGTLTPAQILAAQAGSPFLPALALRVLAPDFQNPRTLQVTGGFQKQLGQVFGFDSDLQYTKGMHLGTDRDVNLFYDPVTGYPKNPNFQGTGRPRPEFGSIRYFDSVLESEYVALANSFTRRLRDRWQAGGTYTVVLKNEDMGSSGFGYIAAFNNPFCLECEKGTAGPFQRHTIRLNGIYEAPWGITLSGIYSYGSGTRLSMSAPVVSTLPIGVGSTTTGTFGINRYVGADITLPETVTWPDGSVHNIKDLLVDGTPTSYKVGDIVPRNALKGPSFSKLDLRVSKTFRIPGSRARVTGMAEVFNALNHDNYSGLNGALSAAANSFGRANTAFPARTGQLAFRVDF